MLDNTSFYIIGDVHGCFNTLMALIKKLPNKDAKLVFVGDLIDRGTQSAQVIEFVKNKKHSCILGNHELMMIRALSHIHSHKAQEYFEYWKTNGGTATIESYKSNKYNIKEHLQWLETLPHYLKSNLPDANGYKLLITHGAGIPFYDLLDIAKEEITTNRAMTTNSYKTINVFGHSPFKSVKFYQNYIGIDTGCYLKGYLTALEWPSKQIFQQVNIE